MAFSDSELKRYGRQLLVEGWDQEKLKNATVAVIGLGGLGGISATYLAAAGVGQLRLIDSDKVELSNLNRQILFSSDDIGQSKAALAQKRLLALNPDIRITSSSDIVTENNVRKHVLDCQLIIDGLDNHQDRLILNKASFELKIPYIYGAINEWQGQLSFLNPPTTPCLACILSRETNIPKPVPVFGALPGVIGALQASMALRYLVANDAPLAGHLLVYHADSMSFEKVSFDKNPHCPVCA